MKKFFTFTLLINLCLLGSAEVKDCSFNLKESQVKHYSLGYFLYMENQEAIWKDVVGYEGFYWRFFDESPKESGGTANIQVTYTRSN